jgi:hypothetical protein
MNYVDENTHLRVEVQAQDCHIPPDELTRMQASLSALGEAVQDFPQSELLVKINHHPRQEYHVDARLKVPGQTFFSVDRDLYLDTAFHRCVRKLTHKAEDYDSNPDRGAVETAARLNAPDRDAMMPEARDAGPLCVAQCLGDYRTFRNGLSGYEEWVGKRVGRWLKRYPNAAARISDVVEEVLLNAFERFGQRPVQIPLNQWLDKLIDPSAKMILCHP